MKKTLKYILIASIGTFCFTALIVANFIIIPELAKSVGNDNEDNNGDSEKSKDVYNITLIVDFKGQKENIKIEDFSLHDEETTAFDAVNKWCDVIYEIYPSGDYYLTHINDVGEGWIYHVNDDYPNCAVNRYNLKNEDVVEYTYVGT